MDVTELLTSVKDRYGIGLRETHTGGGCMALEARLESGHWIVATDNNLMGLRERIAYESENETPMGWFIGIYPNNTEHGEDWWGGGDDPIVDSCDYDLFAKDLPVMIGKALAQLVNSK